MRKTTFLLYPIYDLRPDEQHLGILILARLFWPSQQPRSPISLQNAHLLAQLCSQLVSGLACGIGFRYELDFV